jgi:hypothetical protein
LRDFLGHVPSVEHTDDDAEQLRPCLGIDRRARRIAAGPRANSRAEPPCGADSSAPKPGGCTEPALQSFQHAPGRFAPPGKIWGGRPAGECERSRRAAPCADSRQPCSSGRRLYGFAGLPKGEDVRHRALATI